MKNLRPYRQPLQSRQQGLTMVELLVAMLISTFIAIAAISALLISRQGFTAVDAASQLRDNARFATDILQRIGVQTGFQDVLHATTIRAKVKGIDQNPIPSVYGFNNSSASISGTLVTPTTRTTGTLGYGSDIMVLQYQANETFPGSGVSDYAMINCMGDNKENSTATKTDDIAIDRDDRMFSVFYVATGSDGEPALMCRTSSGVTQPLIQGVENFQVLYGVDGVTAGSNTLAASDSIPELYLRADQIGVAGVGEAANNNWRRVRSIRIGIVLRGPPGSSQDRNAQTYYPFGTAIGSVSGAIGSAMSSSNDPGTVFSPTPDGRLRQVVTFTVFLRNEQAN